MLKADWKPRARRTNSYGDPGSFTNRKAVLPGIDRQSHRLAEDIGLARDWLANGAPVADVITVLEARHRFELSPAHCRALAVEILWAARGRSQPNADFDPNPKETANAAA